MNYVIKDWVVISSSYSIALPPIEEEQESSIGGGNGETAISTGGIDLCKGNIDSVSGTADGQIIPDVAQGLKNR